MIVTAWHFVRRDNAGQPVLRDGRNLVVGEWLTHDGPAEICISGLHASRRPLDALAHCNWEGSFVCLVDCDDVVAEESQKLVCRRRRARWAIHCDPILCAFARKVALSVLHLWPDAPAVVREYLETGNEELRGAARAAAWAAVWAAARGAARAAARAAAGAAARGAARAAARAAARGAARGAARAVWDAVRGAPRDAARDAVWAAVWAAAGAAARDAKISELNGVLEQMFLAAAPLETSEVAVPAGKMTTNKIDARQAHDRRSRKTVRE